MIRRFLHLAAALTCVLGLQSEAHAHPVYASGPAFVPAPPPAPVYVRPPCPSRTHVWVDGRWSWSGYQYVWVPGYWATSAPQVVYAPAQPAYAPGYVAAPAPVYYAPRPAYYGPARPLYRPTPAVVVAPTRTIIVR